MKSFILSLLLMLSVICSLPAAAARHHNQSDIGMMTMPEEMKGTFKQMLQVKGKMIVNHMMVMGIKMYVMGSIMVKKEMNPDMGKQMMSSGIQMYQIARKMNQNQDLDMRFIKMRNM